MTTRTLRAAAVAAALTATALTAAASSAAAAAKGWKLPTYSTDQSGLKVSSYAVRCGNSKFGAWKFRGRMEAEGQFANIRWKVTVTKNGTAHPLTGLKVTGTAPESAKQSIRAGLSGQSVRYATGPARLETLLPNGDVSATRKFQPKRTRC